MLALLAALSPQACPSTCLEGFTCDHYVSMGAHCDTLQSQYFCDCTGCGCTVPGLHDVALAAPVGQKCPSAQTTQSLSLVMERLSAVIVAFWCRPCGQGSAAEAPARQYVPGVVQAEQAVLPGDSWYLPASQ